MWTGINCVSTGHTDIRLRTFVLHESAEFLYQLSNQPPYRGADGWLVG